MYLHFTGELVDGGQHIRIRLNLLFPSMRKKVAFEEKCHTNLMILDDNMIIKMPYKFFYVPLI